MEQSIHKSSAVARSLEGLQLSSIEFVQDYIQLHFDGPRLTAFTLPAVEVAGRLFTDTSPGYRDRLCEQIGKTIGSVHVLELNEMRLVFRSSEVFSISLRSQDRRAGESVIIDNGEAWEAW